MQTTIINYVTCFTTVYAYKLSSKITSSKVGIVIMRLDKFSIYFIIVRNVRVLSNVRALSTVDLK